MSQAAGAQHNLDPLYVRSLDAAVRLIQMQVTHRDPGRDTYYLEVAPDKYFKYFISGGGQYSIRVPDARVDAPLEGEWHETTFVNYLRICLQWAGFPGFAFRNEVTSAELARLREGLMPL